MRDDVTIELSELYPEREVDDLHLARLRRRILDEPPQRRRRPPKWLGAAAAVVVAALIGTFVASQRPPIDPVQSGAPVRSLWEAADRLQQTADRLEEWGMPEEKYRHLHYTIWQTTVIESDGKWQADQREYVIDVWLPTDDGEEVTVDKHPTGNVRHIAGEKLIDPEAVHFTETPPLWGTQCEKTPCHEDSVDQPLSVDPKTKLADASSRLLSPFTTNEEKAGTFRELASVPAIRYEDGRISVDGGKTRFTIDPGTGQVTGSEEVQVGPGRLPEGSVLRSITVTEEWTDQRPS